MPKHESESTYICMDNSRISEKPFLVPLGFGGYFLACTIDIDSGEIYTDANKPYFTDIQQRMKLKNNTNNKLQFISLKKCKNLKNLKSQKCICRNVLCKLLNDLYIFVHFYA